MFPAAKPPFTTASPAECTRSRDAEAPQRKPSAAKLRQRTEESLRNALFLNKMSEKFLEDKVDEYMSFYDDLSYINSQIIEQKKNGNLSLKSYMDAVAEKRRISSEMRSILNFLGLKPTDVIVSGGDADEEL